MASAWGDAFGIAWSNAWGSIDTGGGGSSATTKKKKKKPSVKLAEVFELELETKDTILEPAKEIAPQPEEPVKTYTQEEVGGEELFNEYHEIKAEVQRLQDRLLAEEITQAEYDKFMDQETEALRVIIMALRLDELVVNCL